MRKFVIIFLLIIAVIGLTAFPTTSAVAEGDGDNTIYSFYSDFCSAYRDRTEGTNAELQSAYFIMQKLQSFGLVAVDGTKSASAVSENAYLQKFSDTYQEYDLTQDDYVSATINSQNVVAYLRSEKADAKLLVIGCAYGNVYGLSTVTGDQVKSEGAYETSSAVATLIGVANRLKQSKNLDFDVAFAFFGADAFDCMGAKKFLSTNKQEILAYINLASISGGDYLYAYYDDVSTKHGKLFDDIIKKYSLDIQKAPFDKKSTMIGESDSTERPYWHIGLNSSNYLFMEKGIASVNLFGYNWNRCQESSKHADIIRTSSDTFSFMDLNYGAEAISERMKTACNLVVYGVLKNGELVNAVESYDTGYSKLYSSGVYYGILFSCIGLAIIVFIVGAVFATKKTRKAGIPDFSTNSAYFNGKTESDNSDDIFGMDDSTVVEGNSEDIDTDEKKTSDSSDKKDDDDDIFGEF